MKGYMMDKFKVEFTDAATQEIKEICRKTGCNKKEAMQYALTLLKIYVQMKEEGKRVIGIKINKKGKPAKEYMDIDIPIYVPDITPRE